jgi:hypothetical protein
MPSILIDRAIREAEYEKARLAYAAQPDSEADADDWCEEFEPEQCEPLRLEGLSNQCVANCDNIRTVSRTAPAKRIGRLGPHRHSEVKRAIGYAFDWNELFAS